MGQLTKEWYLRGFLSVGQLTKEWYLRGFLESYLSSFFIQKTSMYLFSLHSWDPYHNLATMATFHMFHKALFSNTQEHIIQRMLPICRVP